MGRARTLCRRAFTNRAAEWSLRASLIELGIAVLVLADSAAVGREGTTRGRHAWAEDNGARPARSPRSNGSMTATTGSINETGSTREPSAASITTERFAITPGPPSPRSVDSAARVDAEDYAQSRSSSPRRRVRSEPASARYSVGRQATDLVRPGSAIRARDSHVTRAQRTGSTGRSERRAESHLWSDRPVFDAVDLPAYAERELEPRQPNRDSNRCGSEH